MPASGRKFLAHQIADFSLDFDHFRWAVFGRSAGTDNAHALSPSFVPMRRIPNRWTGIMLANASTWRLLWGGCGFHRKKPLAAPRNLNAHPTGGQHDVQADTVTQALNRPRNRGKSTEP